MIAPSMLMVLMVLAFAALALWMTVRILRKAGLSGWWCLVTLVPGVNLIMIWVFAFARWPALEPRGDDAAF
ncbi:MAG: hypothetical protein V3R85_05530 [Alphaproteobacteria bacterium]